MTSLYQRELQDNVNFYKDFEKHLSEVGYRLPEESRFESIKDFIQWMYDDSVIKIKERFSKTLSPIKYKWIGINPFPHIDDPESLAIKTKQLYNVLKSKCITTSWLDKSAFVVEVFTESGTRPHIHMITINDIRPARMISQLSKWFKCEKNMIEVNSMTFGYEEKFKYISGIKKESKIQYVDKDYNYREKLNIPHLYNNL